MANLQTGPDRSSFSASAYTASHRRSGSTAPLSSHLVVFKDLLSETVANHGYDNNCVHLPSNTDFQELSVGESSIIPLFCTVFSGIAYLSTKLNLVQNQLDALARPAPSTPALTSLETWSMISPLGSLPWPQPALPLRTPEL